jgi:hypothetical protein
MGRRLEDLKTHVIYFFAVFLAIWRPDTLRCTKCMSGVVGARGGCGIGQGLY